MFRENIKILWVFLLIVILFFLNNEVLASKSIQHYDPDFELSIPDNFMQLPDKLMPIGWLYGFKERTGMRDEPQISIGLEKVSGEFEDTDRRVQELKRKFTLPGSNISIELFNVSTQQVKGIRVLNTVERVKSIMFIAELPVQREFIRIIVGGNAEREQETILIFENILLSFNVKNTNGDGYPKIISTIIVLLGILGMFFWGRRLFRRKK